MNILIYIEQVIDENTGGVQRSTSKLARIFRDKGHRVLIGSSSPHQKFSTLSSDIDVVQIHSKASLKEEINTRNIQVVLNQSGYSLSITKRLTNIKPELKVINTLRINPLNFHDNYVSIISRYLDDKGLSFLNNAFVRKWILRYHILKQRYELGYIIHHVDAFVMLSERFKPELFQLVPGVEKMEYKIFGINNPFDVPKLNITEMEKENVILYVGRLVINQKRVDRLLEIWQELHRRLLDWQFWVVGHGKEEEYMKQFCQSNGMNRVRFFGKQKPDEYYKKARIFHLTSDFEGFGNVLVEAQSYGCIPILFNTYAAAEDIVDSDVNGVLIEPNNTTDYIEVTFKLTQNPKRLLKMAHNAHVKSKEFSFEATYKKWEEVLLLMAEKSRGS